MKIAVLSDIHGNGVALRQVIDDLKVKDIRKIIVLGDIVLKGPMPSECLDMLMNGDLEVVSWIKGNTDLWLEEVTEHYKNIGRCEREQYLYCNFAKEYLNEAQMDYLKKLPLQSSFVVNGTSILCVHGTPKSIVEAIDDSVPEEYIKEAVRGVKEDIILSGHSHTSYIGKVDNKKIFNVGSIGNSLDGDNRISYGILVFTQDEVKLTNCRLEYPVNEIIDIAEKRTLPYLEQYKKVILGM